MNLLKKTIDFFPFTKIEENSSSFYKILIICFIELVLIISIFPLVFETNDDATMNSIASGGLTGQASEYLIFTNIIIGNVLKLLFTTIPEINWYTWYLIFSYFGAYLAIQYTFSKLKSDLWVSIIKHILILSFLLSILLILQFTRIAAVSLSGGFLLLFFSKKGNFLELFFGITLIILGALIRHHVFLMYLLLSIPFIIILLIQKQKYKIIYISIAIILAFSAIKYDNSVYEKYPNFKQYQEFNKLRSKITTHDNPDFNYYNKKDITEIINWTKNDFYLATFFNIDIGHPKFTTENIKLIVNKPESFIKKTFSRAFLSKLKSSFYNVKNYLKDNYIYIISYLLVILVLGKKWKEIIILFTYFSFIVFLAFLLDFYLNGALKARVFFGMNLPLLLLSIYYLDFNKLLKSKILKLINKKILIIFFIILATIPLILSTITFNKKNKAIAASIERSKLNYNIIKQKEDKLYVSWVPLSYNIFDLPYKQEFKYSLGWLAGSPFNKIKIEKYTAKKNIGIYTIFDKNIIWYFTNDKINKKMKTIVTSFYQTNYDNCIITTEKLAVSKGDTISRITYFIPN